MSTQLETVIVPWFSREEWLEVYHGTYSNDVERWKEARDTMLVWQARVSKLPIGVDLTLPLLQARIVDADPFVDTDVKSIMQGTALQRFVSNVVKLPQTMYYSNQNMHKLAANIGLPAHLVDLRNEIIHGDSGWVGGCTISEALEKSFAWIKGYYWTPELRQMKQRNMKKDWRREKSIQVWKRFLRALESYTETTFIKAVGNGLSGELCVKKFNSVIQGFQYLYPNDPNACIEAVVVHLLAPSRRQEGICHSGKKADCGCLFNLDFVKAVDNVLSSVLTSEGSTELLLLSLINNMQKNKEIFMEWIKILIRSLIDLPVVNGEEEYCREHLLHVENKEAINWKKMISKLLDLEEESATDLAVRIVNSSETGIPESQVKQITNLLMLAKCGGGDKNQTDIANGTVDDSLFNLESIIEHTSKHSVDAMNISEKVKASTLPSSITCARTPLGILPHQMDNKQFYKDLLLYYPGDKDFEPPMKRKKT